MRQLDRNAPTLMLDFDGTLHVGNAILDERGNVSLDSGRRLLEFAPLLADLLVPYPDVQIVLTTSWLHTLDQETVVAFLPEALARRIVDTTQAIKPRLSHILDGSERTYVVTSYALGKRLSCWMALDDRLYGMYSEGTSASNFLKLDSNVGLNDPAVLQRIHDWLVASHAA